MSYLVESGQKVGFLVLEGLFRLVRTLLTTLRPLCGHFFFKSGQPANPVFMRVPGLCGHFPTYFI